MMFVSIVGQAIFQTAERNGPSTMERSYRAPGRGAGVEARCGAAVVVGGGAGTAASVTPEGRSPPIRPGGSRAGAPASHRHRPIVNGALALTVPHCTVSDCRGPMRSIEIVSSSSGFTSLPSVIGARPISSAG